MQVLFKVLRQDAKTTPRIQNYRLEVTPSTTILDCLNQIKWEQDGSLAFRKNCRNTICGSCAIRINGRSALACKENVGDELRRAQSSLTSATAAGELGTGEKLPEIAIAPLGNMPVLKDLVVDMQPFWHHLKAVDPVVKSTPRSLAAKEFLQSPQERSQLNQPGNCILCGACYSECNAREVNPDFVGPHALAKGYRLVADSRDRQTEARLEQYNEGTSGVWGCTRCYYCNAVCPMDVAPMDQIGKIKQAILRDKSDQASRAIRHRKTLVSLVKQGGWVDERLFGVQVVGNSFRDWGGLASLVPLGLRMVGCGKFPVTFEKSQGTKTVRSLIDSVQTLTVESKSAGSPNPPDAEAL